MRPIECREESQGRQRIARAWAQTVSCVVRRGRDQVDDSTRGYRHADQREEPVPPELPLDMPPEDAPEPLVPEAPDEFAPEAPEP